MVVIITKFNLRLWDKDKNGNSTNGDEWLEERFHLFEEFCLPSLMCQTYKDFIWLVLFDNKTPDKWRKKVDEFEHNCPQLYPCFLSEKETKEQTLYVKEQIRKLYKGDGSLITIRLDNDDAICADFVNSIMSVADQQRENLCCYSFPWGIQYYTTGRLAMKIPYINNHFLVLVNKHFNPNEDFGIISQYNHYFHHKFPFPFVSLEYYTSPMWAEVIHERNVDNDCKMTIRQCCIGRKSYMRERFGWKVELSIVHNLWTLPFFLFPRFCQQFWRRFRDKMRKQ